MKKDKSLRVTSTSSTQTGFLWTSSNFCQRTNIVLAGVTCKISAQDQNLKSYIRIVFVRSNQRSVCQFPSVQKCWGCLGCLALFYHNRNPVSDLPKGTESWFQKTHPSFIAHTCTKHSEVCSAYIPLPSSQHLTQHTLLKNTQLAQAHKFGSQILVQDGITPGKSTYSGWESNLYSPAWLRAPYSSVQNSEQLSTSLCSNLQGKLILNCTSIECMQSLPLLCMEGEVEEGKRGCIFFYTFLRGAMWFLLYDYSPAHCDLLSKFKRESDTATKREVGGELS